MKKLFILLTFLISANIFGATEYVQKRSDVLKSDIKFAKKLLKNFGKVKQMKTVTSDILFHDQYLWTNTTGEAEYSDGSRCRTTVVTSMKTIGHDPMKGFSVKCYNENDVIFLDTFDSGVTP